MTTILIAIAVFAVLFAAMAIGIMFGRPPIKGSCGGMSALTQGECEICGGDRDKCEEVSRAQPPGDEGKAVRRFDPRRDDN